MRSLKAIFHGAAAAGGSENDIDAELAMVCADVPDRVGDFLSRPFALHPYIREQYGRRRGGGLFMVTGTFLQTPRRTCW